jgi:Uma2 family endonuclease
MDAATTLLTVEELLAMGEDKFTELVDGVLVRMTPAGGRHGAVGIRMSVAVCQHVSTQRLGECFGSCTGFVLGRNPDTVRAPDVAFVSTSRLPRAWASGGFLEVAPDLAVEVLSPSDTASMVLKKVGQYRRAGVRLVWVIDPVERTVTVYEPDLAVRHLSETDTLDGGAVLSGFRCAIASLFEGIPQA